MHKIPPCVAGLTVRPNEPAVLPDEFVQGCSHDLPDEVPPGLRGLIGTLPRRWGRMDRLSRITIAATAWLLSKVGPVPAGKTAGFISGSRYGCLETDLEFLASLDEGLPSPLLFSYTLPNISASEAATHFGLTGPVYSVLDMENPFRAAVCKAALHIGSVEGPDFMIAGCIDVFQRQPVESALVMLQRGEPLQPAS